MNMPGFTAEASLYQADRSYQMSRSFDAPTCGRVIVPEARLVDPHCFALCRSLGGSTRECFRGCSFEAPE